MTDLELDPDEQAFLDLHAPREEAHVDVARGAAHAITTATTRQETTMPDKLIRDRIPEIAAANGDYLTVRTARPGELPGLLRAKLAEPATEAMAADDDTLLDELADVIETAHALGAHHGHSPADIEAARAAKAAQRGRFQQQLVLIDTALDTPETPS